MRVSAFIMKIRIQLRAMHSSSAHCQDSDTVDLWFRVSSFGQRGAGGGGGGLRVQGFAEGLGFRV